ncbi:hypothetical protein Droror1_Dr00026565 [Drosera rotundifolia]
MSESETESTSERRRFVIGYALAAKKENSFMKPSLISMAKDRSIDLVRIDTSKPLVDQGPFDCVLHKFYGDDWKRELDEYRERNPRVVILDSPDAIQRLHNRISMLQFVSELKARRDGDDGKGKGDGDGDSSTFGIPKQIVIYDVETLRDNRAWEGLRFPVIAKPLVADGSAKSHKMSLVYDHEALGNLKPPIVLQEFVNHGGVIFKVYVVGEYVKCVKRKSLPDVTEEEIGSLGGLLTFSQVSNLSSNKKIDEFFEKNMHLDDCEMPPQGFIAKIASGLREGTKLNLFNFDVIRDTRLGNRYLVIDINYFPGYAKMPSYETVFADFFWDVVTKKQVNVGAVRSDAGDIVYGDGSSSGLPDGGEGETN